MTKLTGLEALESQKKFLTLLGIWPTKNETVFYRLRYYLTMAMSAGFASLIFLEMPNRVGNYGELSELIGLCITPVIFCFKAYIVKSGNIAFVKLLQNMKQYPVEAAEKEMLDTVKFSKRLVIVCTVVYSSTTLVFVLQPLLGNQDLPIPVSYCDLGRYERVMYGFQASSAMLLIAGLAFIDCLTINVINVGNAKLEVLSKKIRNTSNLEKDSIAQEFSDIVVEHNGLIQ